MSDCIYAMGFKGIIAPYNNGLGIQTTLTRRNQQAVAMNTYHDANDNIAGPIFQTSSFDDAVSYFRNAAAMRLAGKPFVMTEYDHVFWNRYRYEAGLAMPAYAALQNWDILCRHSNGALILSYGGSDFNEQYIRPYRTALDPVARAGETLSAILFRRGDVAKAGHRVVAQIPDIDNMAGLDMQEQDAVTIMSLLSSFAQGDAPLAPDAVSVSSPRQIGSREDAITFLRNNGVLAATNPSDPASGIYVSDTGEIRLDTAAKQMRVVTQHTEALAFLSITQPVQLGQLWVGSASGAGMLAVSSLDGQTVADSSKLLLIFTTDARNTDMVFGDSEEKTVSSFGSLPVHIKVGYVWFKMPIDTAWRISPVGLDGAVQPPAVAGNGSGGLNVELWNNVSALPSSPGPTTYFLIEHI